MSFRQNNLRRGFQFTGFVFDQLTLDLKLEAIDLVFVFNNVIYNIKDLAAGASNLKSEFKKLKTNAANPKTTHLKRGFNRSEAAGYIGVGTTKFDVLVKQRRMPQPRVIDKRKVWDVCELDEYFDQLPQRGERPRGTWS